MSALAGHLHSLLRAPEDIQDGQQLAQTWLSYRVTYQDSDIVDSPSDEVDNYSVLDVYRTAPDQNSSGLLKTITLKENAVVILDSMRSLLVSPRSNDEISDQLADLVGYEDIELVFNILEHRPSIVLEIDAFTSAQAPSSKPTDFSGCSARARIESTLRENAARPLFTGIAQPEAELLPHVYTASSMAQGNVLSHLGTKYLLPEGTIRHAYKEYDEVIIPPAKTVPPRVNERLIPVSELDAIGQGSFLGYTSLNRIQSIVYPTAYGSNENILVCAPTGAGKTDVAMMTILRVLDQHRTKNSYNISASINRDSFKIIYVAPMKALASEIVRKLGKRLKWLSITVKELTGDMQLTKAEIAQTQIIVTTPEKWDVVTRKPSGEGELSSLLKLLIIDEVHLLNEERGAVIETIVARTLRQVESSQSIIRIVGLSATLPNYLDVAEFLSVPKHTGLFFFDSSFRPVPLEQHFLGIKGKAGSALSRKNLDRVTFQKVSELVAQDHQVMVFVHSRKETVKTALGIKELATLEGNIDDFSCHEHPQFSFFRRDIGQSRNKEMKQMFDNGFGIHHAGMLRSDRNMMERMFAARAIKVLCCTATLAWGVNLPAHAVVIKGTQVYDSSKGAFVDLSVLDVLQVFGRAGRPGLETSGEGYICTTDDKLTHYLDAVTSQLPIESQFRGGMTDALNAEVSLGTVANTRDAVQWLGYTYLFVRMRKNPFLYGILRDSTADDPQLGSKRDELVTEAAQTLSNAGMIIFDRTTGALTITDLGRIAAKYYIQYKSIEIFNEKIKPIMTEADVIATLSLSTEFEQIQVRDSEEDELKALQEIVPCEVKGGTETSPGKVNILLQGYISKQPVEDFALVSDMAYVAQNGGRIIRAMLEIAISRKWATVTAVLMGMSKAIEQRLWPFDQPLRQFPLKADVFYSLDTWANECSPAELAGMDVEELGKLLHLNAIHGKALLNAVKQFPSVKIDYNLRPLGSDVLKISVRISRAFVWNTNVHGSSQPFWLWVEDHEGVYILQLHQLLFRQMTEVIDVDFVISIPNGIPPPLVRIHFVSDRWMGAEDEIEVPLTSLTMPPPSSSHTPILDLPFLNSGSLRNDTIQNLFSGRLNNFNAIQTQVFWSLLHTQSHSLLCAPTGSGKTMMVEALVWATALRVPDAFILVVTPRRSAAIEIAAQLRIGSALTNITVDIAKDKLFSSLRKQRRVVVSSVDVLFKYLCQRNPQTPLRGITLVVFENLEQMDAQYELTISLLRHATQTYPTRLVGISNSLNDPSDLASWLNVDPFSLHSFRPKDRGQSLAPHVQTFNIPQSASLFKAMAKPSHAAIMSGDSSLVFVASRAQCRSVAMDLLTQCALQLEVETGYLPPGFSEEYLEEYRRRLRDPMLFEFISKGIGFYHEGMRREDRNLVLELYADGIVRVIIVPHDSCWAVPVRASVVVVMGTQYMHFEDQGSERQLRDYELVQLVRMQGRAVKHSGTGSFYLFCQVEAKDALLRFMNDGLPLESQLLETNDLLTWYQEQTGKGNVQTRQDMVNVLCFTFLGQRVSTNPAYYGCEAHSRDENLSRIVDNLAEASAG